MLNKYLEKRNIPGASDMWTKWTAILLSVGIFYVSPASQSTIDASKPDFYYNNTMMKEVIRKIATEGSRFATAFSDTGLAAYLRFVAHKEYLTTTVNIRNEVANNILPRQIQFSYENPMANLCILSYNGKNTNDYYVNSHNNDLNKKYIQGSAFFQTNGIDQLHTKYCDSVIKNTYSIPYGQYVSLLALADELDNLDNEMAYATEIMTHNLYSLQQKFGWVNVFTVPFSYYMMKFNDMFLDQGIDYDKISDKAKNYVESLNLKEAGLVGFPQESALETVDTIGTALTTYASRVAAWTVSKATIIGGYMLLPGFTPMFEFIDDHLKSILNAKLLGEIRDGIKQKSSIQNIIGKVKSIVGKVASLASRVTPVGLAGKIMSFLSIDFDKFPALVNAVIPIIAFVIAVMIWTLLFKIVFITMISFIILLKIVFYFVDLLVYFITSIFVVLWAFTIQSQQLILNYLKRGLVLLVTPTLIVFTVFIFIFVYELMNVLYIYLLNIFIEVQSISNIAYSQASWEVDGFSAQTIIGVTGTIIEVTIQLISVLLAYVIIYKGTDWILETIGLGDAKLITTQATQETMQKGERYVNPI